MRFDNQSHRDHDPSARSLVGGVAHVFEENLMINSIEIENFRCYESIRVERCSLVNVIVGDSGSGKTSLLEAIFLPLAPTTEIAVRFRQQRGLDAAFSGDARSIEDGIFGDIFHNRDMSKAVRIQLSANGQDDRSLTIARGGQQMAFFPLVVGAVSQGESLPITFTWKDSHNQIRSLVPQIGANGLQFPSTGESIPDFYYFASNYPVGSSETAMRFSKLSRKNEDKRFVELLGKEFEWIKGLSIEISGGSASIHATVAFVPEKIPLPNVSGSFNRIVSILVAMASQRNGVVLIDEMENGVYYKHHEGTWRLLLLFAREFNCQIFTTTHSQEWLKALVSASGDRSGDISLWRVERQEDREPHIYQFSGDDLRDGIEYGSDVR